MVKYCIPLEVGALIGWWFWVVIAVDPEGWWNPDTDPPLGGIDRTDYDRTAQGKAEVV